MRITQSMMMGSYTNRLGKVLSDLNTATLKAQNQRKFLSAAEDPAGSARAAQLRRNMQKNEDYLNNTLEIIDTLDSVHSNMLVLSDMASYIKNTSLLSGQNGTWTVDERQIIANEIRTMQQTCIDSLNSKFDDKYMFGGTSTQQLPFELSEDGKTLTFRGIDVTDASKQNVLQNLANEKIYIDIGLGLTVDTSNGAPEVQRNSAFNTAHPGISFIGFGTDPSDNFILNLGLIADTLEQDPLDEDLLGAYSDKLGAQFQNILTATTKLDSEATFLKQRVTVLERNNDNLNSKILNVEYMDMELALSLFNMAQYTYNASLSMGTKILTPSFIDFMS